MRLFCGFFVILLLTAVSTADEVKFVPIDGAKSREIFAKFKGMTGNWEGKSTAGWEGTTQSSVIAKGSVMMSLSRFNDTPNEGMATMFFMDGDRLLLTHFCEAGNQPTLVASGIDETGNSVEFTFLSGTNLPSRDTGHMDHVIYNFQDNNNFTSHWTWYTKGKETWLEKITYQRAK
jgi:hypothetical protein